MCVSDVCICWYGHVPRCVHATNIFDSRTSEHSWGWGRSFSFLLLWVPGPNSGIQACRVSIFIQGTILPVHAFSDIYLFVQKVAIKMGWAFPSHPLRAYACSSQQIWTPRYNPTSRGHEEGISWRNLGYPPSLLLPYHLYKNGEKILFAHLAARRTIEDGRWEVLAFMW